MTQPPVVRLDSVAEVRLGRQRSPKDHVGPQMRPYVRAANVGWEGLLLDDVKAMNFTDDEMMVYGLQPGDVLLNEASGSALEVGKPAIWAGEIDGCAFQNTLLRVRPLRAEPRYLLHYFKRQAATGAFARQSRGVGIHHLGREALAAWPVPLPPRDEQRRINDLLDQADTIRGKRKTSLDLVDQLAGSMFADMFGDPQRNPRGWPVKPLRELAVLIQIGPFGSLLHQSDYVEDGIPLVNPMHIVDGRLRADRRHAIGREKAAELGKYALCAGDVVLGRRGEMGRCAVVREEDLPAICGSGSLFVRPDTDVATSTYLQTALSSPYLRQLLERDALGITMLNLNSAIVGSLPLPAPPVVDQARFALALQSLDVERRTLARSSTQLDTLLASLQHRAFSGAL